MLLATVYYLLRDEVQQKYGMLYNKAYKLFTDVFNCLPLAALIAEPQPPAPIPNANVKMGKSTINKASAGTTT